MSQNNSIILGLRNNIYRTIVCHFRPAGVSFIGFVRRPRDPGKLHCEQFLVLRGSHSNTLSLVMKTLLRKNIPDVFCSLNFKALVLLGSPSMAYVRLFVYPCLPGISGRSHYLAG